MDNVNDKITMVIGAGAPLGFELPEGIEKPTTGYITDEVRKPYKHFDKRDIDIVEKMYQLLESRYPLTPSVGNDWKLEKEPVPNINFEMLFHVMESYLTNNKVWSGNCHNADISPVFSLFTKPSEVYNAADLNYIMPLFIQRIMDIVDRYDQYYKCNKTKESWYRDFFCHSDAKLDVFNFNYDTTVEESIGIFEDGFEPFDGTTGVERFNPRKLWNNSKNLSTINHIHGCIHYFYPSSRHTNDSIYTIHDLFKYKDYATVRDLMNRSGQSNPTTQDNSEYFGGPIITGLRKTDKLNCIPYDFYHGHLYNCLLRNKALVIVGYSFGDYYLNNLIDRMSLLHGDKKKVVVVDYWEQNDIDRVGFEHYLSYNIPANMCKFLMRMSEVSNAGTLAKDLKSSGMKSLYYSSNRNLMVLSGGFKDASQYVGDIYDFLV